MNEATETGPLMQAIAGGGVPGVPREKVWLSRLVPAGASF